MAGAVCAMAERVRTEVVLTPQSKSDEMDEGAGGVSIHSKVSSEVVPLILLNPDEFCKTKSKGVVFSRRLHVPSRNGVAH
jgi:hypothetical protein